MTRARVVPGQRAVAAVAILTAGVAAAIIIGVPAPTAAGLASFAFSILLAVAVWDWFTSLRAWRQAAPTLMRRLPSAFAIGIARVVPLTVVVQGARTWRCTLHDHADASMVIQGLPAALVAPGGKRVDLEYTVTPTRRGDVTFAPARAGACGSASIASAQPKHGESIRTSDRSRNTHGWRATTGCRRWA